MGEYLAPGVYIEEFGLGAKPIEGVSTSTAGFLGETERGSSIPRLVTSWTEYQRIYGGYFGADKYLPYAVEGFFKNGGQRCYIGRVVGGITTDSAKNAFGYLSDSTGAKTLKVISLGEGTWGNRVTYKVSEGSLSGFRLSLFYWKDPVPVPYTDPQIDTKSLPRPRVEEVYDNLSMDEASPDFYKKRVNGISNLITLDDAENGLPQNEPIAFSGTIDKGKNATIEVNNATILTSKEGKEIIVIDNNKGEVRKIISVAGATATVDKSWDKTTNKTYIIVETMTQEGKVSTVDVINKKITLPKETTDNESTAITDPNKKLYIQLTSGEKKDHLYLVASIDANKKEELTLTENLTDVTKNDNYRLLISYENATDASKVTNPTITFKTITNNLPTDMKNLFISVHGNKGIQTNTITTYDTNSKTATLSHNWKDTSDLTNTSSFVLCCGKLVGGAEALVALTDYQGKDEKEKSTGLFGFALIDGISILYAPNSTDVPGLTQELIAHCEGLKDRFAIIDALQNEKLSVSPKDDFPTEYGAYYYPWIKIIDPQNGMKKIIPPGGYMAGIYARTDTERGVHKAPANAKVRGVIEMEFPVSKAQQDILNPKGVNCIRAFPGRGIRVWGARTLASDPSWKYINVRRLFIFLEQSIDVSTQWVVFEPNNNSLWARVIQTLSNFLLGIWKSGALMGTSPEEGFFVKCDRSTMTQDDIDNGRLIIIVGIAPTKPAEFVIFRFAQWTANANN